VDAPPLAGSRPAGAPAQVEAAPYDVLIVGAGLSGIGAARHLQRRCPGKRFVLLEGRAAIGGTWDLFRYPGVRSDSDMYTLGYDFRPWGGAKLIADGPEILEYIRRAAQEGGIEAHIRFGHRVRSASWSSALACWRVEALRADGSCAVLHARFLQVCSGYFRYDRGHRPEFAGEADFRGTLVHAQFWPEGLDLAGRRVVVVGSGATAVTLVPALAQQAASVTMLQRSPTYVVTLPAHDPLARLFAALLPLRWAYGLTRWKNILISMLFYQLARRYPQGMKRRFVGLAQRQLGPDCDAGTHFTPRYAPWDQRLCIAPDGDLFRAIRAGRAQVVTDTIERFTPAGLRLAGGGELAADVVVLATGLELNVLGDIAVQVDGRPLDPARAMSYKGMMLSDVPNLVATFGYTNASWTLKADLTARWTCRLLRYMDRHGRAVAMAPADPGVAPRPFLGLSSGYVQRASARLPKQGVRAPWQVHQNYLRDLILLRYGRIADGVLQFSGAPAPAPGPAHP
jgi:cation diffusion facilitator CzcD-associated flavoprotein CzcO